MFELSQAGKKFVEKELKRYEQKESAIVRCLYRLQKENGGWISPKSIEHLSELMDIPVSKIQAVFSFYTMFNKKRVGRYHIQVCTNATCSLLKGRELVKHILKELGVNLNEVTNDGKYSVSEVECLGACGNAPVMQINDDYYENLTPEKAMSIIRGLN